MSHRARAFIRHWTRVQAPPLVPEIRLHLADELMPLWQALAREAADPELPPPYWAFAWAGGQALARYVLDHPDEVRGTRVVDLATGSGLCAIAASLAGAETVQGADIDPWSADAVALNSGLAGVHVAFSEHDPLDEPPPEADLVLAGDIGYEWNLATRGSAWLRAAADRGTRVLLGDPERHHLPPERLRLLAAYDVPTTQDLEQTRVKHTNVFLVEPLAGC